MRTPETIVRESLAAEGPVGTTFCLFSGGHDSTVLAHRCRDLFDELAHVDTGTALPGVRDFVEFYAGWIGKPLRVLEAGDAYRRMVLGTDHFWLGMGLDDWPRPREGAEADLAAYLTWIRQLPKAERKLRGGAGAPIGFPGPGRHNRAYQRLKERQIRTLVREAKASPRDRVALLSGVRTAESERRKMNAFVEVERAGAQVWISPILGWSNEAMRAYRADHGLAESDVAALIHRSGECNCGAYAAEDEREELQLWYPDWWAEKIAPLEREAEARGIPRCRWGDRVLDRRLRDRARAGRLCSSCPTQQLGLDLLGAAA